MDDKATLAGMLFIFTFLSVEVGGSLQMRTAVKEVAKLFPTAIISGRGREKVAAFVGLQELFYAGSHGLDIIGPQVGVCGCVC